MTPEQPYNGNGASAGDAHAAVPAPPPSLAPNGHVPSEPAAVSGDGSSVEDLLYASRLVSPDQLGEIARAAATTGRDVADIVVEQGIVAPDVLAQMLQADGVQQPAPGLTVVPEPAPVPVAPPAAEAPAPVLPAAPAPAPVAEPVPVPVPAPVVPEPVEVVAPVVEAPVLLPEPVPAPAPVQPVVPQAPVVEAVAQPVAAPVVAPAAPEIELQVLEPAPAVQTPVVPTAYYRVALRLRDGHVIEVARCATDVDAFEISRRILADLSAEGRDWVQLDASFIRPEAVLSVEVQPQLAVAG